MIRDTLSQYFEGVAYKRLSAVEANPSASNQHEFNGVRDLLKLLGKDRKKYDARFILLDDSSEDPVAVAGSVTWYDARESHPTRSEFRLYFPDNVVTAAATEGDLLVIAKRRDAPLVVVVARKGSTAENQVLWLFNAQGEPRLEIDVKELHADDTRLTAARALVLEQIGVEVGKTDENFLERLLRRFPSGFPGTREFSEFARSTLPDVHGATDADSAIIAWWEREELLFRTMERHLVADRLRHGFGEDVDAFVEYSLSVHQTRKARAGRALENHVEQALKDHHLRYARGMVTENRSRPDFLFPGETEYRDASVPDYRLTMLGVKSTCKDRWRQVLTEADRIREKHLITLEPAITTAQTDEMQSNELRLVLPAALHSTYKSSQLGWLMCFSDFVALVRDRQR